MDTTLENILLHVSLSPVLDSGDSQAAKLLLLQACLNGLSISRVSLWCFDKNRDEISCEHLLDNTLAISTDKLTFHRRDLPAYFSALDHQRVIRADNARIHPATVEFVNDYLIPSGIVSMLDVPIRFGGEMIGIICCEQRNTIKHWTDDETHFVAALADLHGRALTASLKKQYQCQLEQLNQQLEQRVVERTEQLEKHINELQQTQAQLVESEKMASLGTLVAGVAHEVNTPLGIAITANSYCIELTDKLKKLLTSNSLSRSKLEETIMALHDSHGVIERTLNRSAELVINFKKTAVDQSSYDIQTINLAEYVLTLVSTLKPYTKAYNVEHIIHCDHPVTITTYPGAIAQVITNLVINACLHAFEQPHSGNQIVFSIKKNLKNIVELTVRDSGKGIEKSEQKRIFEPFYTTKRSNGGSGLGLAIVYNLVASTLGGTISVDSKPGLGTSFRLTLPEICPEGR